MGSSRHNPVMSLSRGWTVVCDARHGSGLGVGHVVLVDQKKENTLWWTSDDPTVIMAYQHKPMAERACARFHHNNPRVVTVESAVQLLAHQNRSVALRTLEKVTQ